MRHEEILYVALGAAAVGLLFARGRKAVGTGRCGVGNLADTPVSLNNLLKGNERGWYRVEFVWKQPDGKYSVRLSGKDARGRNYADYYPISKATYDALAKKGFVTIE